MFHSLDLTNVIRLPIIYFLVDQVIDSIVRQAKGRKVIGLYYSLGSVLTLMASFRLPELFSQVIMLDPLLFWVDILLLFIWQNYLNPK